MIALTSLCVAAAAAGAVLVVAGFLPAPEPSAARAPSTAGRFLRSVRYRLTSRRRLFLGLGILVGIGLWAVSGWIVYLVAMPLAALAIPVLLDAGDVQERLARLDSLESWTRNLAGLTIAGASLEQTIAASLPSVPAPIAQPVSTLVARINARWRTEAALRAFADELDDPTADLLVMHLLLADRMRGPGLARALGDLAESIGEEVRVRRQIDADRAKSRQNVRIITLTTLLLLLALPFVGAFMAPYSTPLGQLLLATWLVLYALVLAWLKRITVPAPQTRTLPGSAG